MTTATQTAPQQEGSTHKSEFIGEQPMDPSDITAQARDPQRIADLAYSYWEARGGSGGSAEEDWLRAEQALYGNSGAQDKKFG